MVEKNYLQVEQKQTYTQKDQKKKSSMKQCPAINEILKQGVIIPSWCELHLECGPKWSPMQRVFPRTHSITALMMNKIGTFQAHDMHTLK